MIDETHRALLESVAQAGSVAAAAIRGMPIWQNYLNRRLSQARELYGAVWPFCDGPLGTVLVALAGGGYGHSVEAGGFNTNVPANEKNVVVFGWTQADLDRDVTLAALDGLTVLRTVRMEDDVIENP